MGPRKGCVVHAYVVALESWAKTVGCQDIFDERTAEMARIDGRLAMRPDGLTRRGQRMMPQDQVRQHAIRIIIDLIRSADDLLIGVPDEDQEAVHHAIDVIIDTLAASA